jgi:transposase
MVRAYSLDLRERVVAAVAEGATCRQAASRFGVSVSAVVKWGQRWRASGSVAPARFGPARRTFKLEAHKEWLAARVAAHPSITTRALARELTEAGTPVSHHAVWTMLRREGLTFKKNRARQRADAAERRTPA